ncbi:hypothetical protein NX059_008792 [Plenodomus lindquistii]|nr:hypothetical protein NX059_008792 [Plenodomus lindquistii]
MKLFTICFFPDFFDDARLLARPSISTSRPDPTSPDKDCAPSKHSHCGSPNDLLHSSTPYPAKLCAMHVSDAQLYGVTTMDLFLSLMVASFVSSWADLVDGLVRSLTWPSLPYRMHLDYPVEEFV